MDRDIIFDAVKAFLKRVSLCFKETDTPRAKLYTKLYLNWFEEIDKNKKIIKLDENIRF